MFKKAYLLCIMTLLISFRLWAQAASSSNFSLSVGYEYFPIKYAWLEKTDKYENGNWLSEKINQNTVDISMQAISIKTELLFPIIKRYLFGGIEFKIGVPLRTKHYSYYIPVYENTLNKDIKMPVGSTLSEYSDINIDNAFINLLISLLFRLDVEIPISKLIYFTVGVGVGSELLYENKIVTIEMKYKKDFSYYHNGESYLEKQNNITAYVFPKSEIKTEIVISIINNIKLGFYVMYGHLFNSSFQNEKKDYIQNIWWPNDRTLTTYLTGAEFKGTNFGSGITIRIY